MNKAFIKDLIPPVVLKFYKASKDKYGWFGNYNTWEAALSDSGGYDSELILNKVIKSTLKVKKGEAAFERDSVLFIEPAYEWPLLSSLLWVAAQSNGKLNLIDFGGSLGSSYFQYRQILNPLGEIKWNVIEQEQFYYAGKKYFEDEILKFYPDISTCLAENKIDVLLLGCVLPYIKEPFILLEEIYKFKIPFLILDRMPFLAGTQDRLTVQRVPPTIYEASYPAWFFSYTNFLKFISDKYSVVAEYDCNDKANIKSTYKGLLLKLKA